MDFSLIQDVLPLFFVLAGVGCLAGLLAGLMGIGGGIVLVPGLYYSLSALGYEPAHLMHMAVGTSLAAMVPTGLSAARSHWKKGAVDKVILKKLGVGVLIGVLAGNLLAGHFSGDDLRAFFAFALMFLAIIMAANPARFAFRDDVPGQPWAGMAGAVIGVIATLMGIGGATMSVPYMSLHKVPMHRAVGTASALGLAISIPGFIGFMMMGHSAEGLPPLSFGYVNLLAFAIIIPFSIIMAPKGVWLAHKLHVEHLRQVFSVLLVIIAGRMLLEVFRG